MWCGGPRALSVRKRAGMGKTMKYVVRYSCVSHRGRKRSLNQDNFICDGRYMQVKMDETEFPLTGSVTNQSASVFGVFDGMGGEERGEMAAYIAAKAAASLTLGKDGEEGLLRFCRDVNGEICSYAQEHEISSMGTTAAMLAFLEEEVVLCNIGDSKVFRFTKEEGLRQLSEDHVMIAAFGAKPPLSQSLGIPPEELIIEPYVAKDSYMDGCQYLICSDGLTDMLKTEEICSILEDAKGQDVAQCLLERALAGGGRDNVSIIACKVEKDKGWLMKRFKRA